MMRSSEFCGVLSAGHYDVDSILAELVKHSSQGVAVNLKRTLGGGGPSHQLGLAARDRGEICECGCRRELIQLDP